MEVIKVIGGFIKVLGFLFKYFKYLPTIVKVVVDAEKFASPTATGADKAAIAKQALSDILTGIFGLPTNDPIFGELGGIIDALVSVLNNLGIFTHKADATPALITQGVAHDLVTTPKPAPSAGDVSRQIEAEIHSFVKQHPEFAPQGLPAVAPQE